MSIPLTPLLCAPSDADNVLGTTISGFDIVRGLRIVNPRICVPDSSTFASFPGMTSLWLGEPWAKGSKYLGAFHLGAVPEFTQIGPDGKMIAKGWRSIFDRIIKNRLATQAAIERVFRINLDYAGTDSLCVRCAREGIRRDHDGGARKMCAIHNDVYAGVERSKASQPELLNRLKWRKVREYVC